MLRRHAAVILNLLAAGEAADDDVGVGVGADCGEESLLADGLCDVVVFLFVAEGTRHPAAAGVELAGGAAGEQREECVGVAGADEGFLVAMAMEEDGFGGCGICW